MKRLKSFFSKSSEKIGKSGKSFKNVIKDEETRKLSENDFQDDFEILRDRSNRTSQSSIIRDHSDIMTFEENILTNVSSIIQTSTTQISNRSSSNQNSTNRTSISRSSINQATVNRTSMSQVSQPSSNRNSINRSSINRSSINRTQVDNSNRNSTNRSSMNQVSQPLSNRNSINICLRSQVSQQSINLSLISPSLDQNQDLYLMPVLRFLCDQNAERRG